MYINQNSTRVVFMVHTGTQTLSHPYLTTMDDNEEGPKHLKHPVASALTFKINGKATPHLMRERSLVKQNK